MVTHGGVVIATVQSVVGCTSQVEKRVLGTAQVGKWSSSRCEDGEEVGGSG